MKTILKMGGGGNDWKQGDWLIHSENIPIRRGVFGQTILELSDFFHTHPVLMVILIQFSIFLWVGYMLKKISNRFSDYDARWILLILPVFFLTFWANDPQGSYRKEMILYAAQASLVASLIDKRFFYAGIFLAAIGFWGHEVNILLAPSIFILIWMTKDYFPKSHILTACCIVLSSCFGAAVYNLSHPSVADVQLICDPLLKRGVKAGLCEGAIQWLSLDTNDAMKKVRDVLSLKTMLLFFLIYTAYGSIWLYVSQKITSRRFSLLILFLFVALVSPLFFLAKDYGRWMNIAFTSSTFIILACSIKQPHVKLELNPKLLLTIAALSILVSHNHMLGLSDSRALLAVVIGYTVVFMVRQMKVLNIGKA